MIKKCGTLRDLCGTSEWEVPQDNAMSHREMRGFAGHCGTSSSIPNAYARARAHARNGAVAIGKRSRNVPQAPASFPYRIFWLAVTSAGLPRITGPEPPQKSRKAPTMSRNRGGNDVGVDSVGRISGRG